MGQGFLSVSACYSTAFVDVGRGGEQLESWWGTRKA